MIEFLSSPLFLHALCTLALASLASGLIGSYVVSFDISLIAGSISHSLLGGIGLSLFLTHTLGRELFSPLLGALITALLASFLIASLNNMKHKMKGPILAAIWSLGMSLGLIFFSKTPNFGIDLSHFLAGNILFISQEELSLLLFLDLLILLFVLLFHTRFVQIGFDLRQALLQRLPVKGLYFLLIFLIALSVVILMYAVGILLTITMLLLPPAIGRVHAITMKEMMFKTIIFSFLLSFIGLGIAYMWNLPVGATIGLTISLLFFVCAPKQVKG